LATQAETSAARTHLDTAHRRAIHGAGVAVPTVRVRSSPVHTRRLSLAALPTLPIPLWQAVLLSRLFVLLAGAIGALAARPVAGWQSMDAHRLSTSLGSVGNVLGAAVVRWDSIAYINVAAHGYTTAASTTRFPLYPLLIRALTPLTGSPALAGALISVTAFAAGLLLIHRLAREYVGTHVADRTVLLLAFSPWSFVFSADYTTALLLVCSAAAFYLAQRRHFIWACVAAAAASVTHVQGILLVAPLAIIYWKQNGRTLDPRRLWSPRLLALALPPLTLGSFFLYLHGRGFGWLAPVTNQDAVHFARHLIGPPATIFYAFKDAFLGLQAQLMGTAPPTGGLPLGTQNCIYLAVLGITLLAMVETWRRLPKEYAVYALLAILLCTSSAVTLEPLKGFDRYMLPIFPLWIAAVAWISQRRLTSAVMLLGSVMLMVDTIQFTRWITVF